MGIFSFESRFMQILNRIGALIIVNVMYIISCIPLITIGAATTALYETCFRISRQEDDHLFRKYWIAMRDNFRQSTVIWLILAFVLGVFACSMRLTESPDSPLHWMHLPQAIAACCILCAGSYLFPMAGRFHNSTANLFRNAPRLALAYFPRTIVMTALNVLPCWILTNTPLFSIRIFPLFLFVYSAFAAYVIVFLLKGVFRPYTEDSATEEPLS